MSRVIRTCILAGFIPWLAVPGCARVEDRDGGLLTPFPDAVAGADAAANGGGSMELPPASDFVTDETNTPPIVVDTGDPPAIVLGDDDDDSAGAPRSAIEGADAVADGAEVPTQAVEPPTPAPAVVVQEPTTPAPVVEVAPVVRTPPPVVTLPSQSGPAETQGSCEAALTVLSPLSEIRLVAAIPEADPARAIVRFPSGAERVVQIGDLLGSSGAKVVEIKPGSLTLAEVTVTTPGQPVLATHYMHVSR
jgi:hypothetical protein